VAVVVPGGSIVVGTMKVVGAEHGVPYTSVVMVDAY
jgi:hypothetical protein